MFAGNLVFASKNAFSEISNINKKSLLYCNSLKQKG